MSDIDATRPRIDLRVKPKDRVYIAVAAAHTGKSLSSFVLAAAMARAREVYRELEEVESEEDSDA